MRRVPRNYSSAPVRQQRSSRLRRVKTPRLIPEESGAPDGVDSSRPGRIDPGDAPFLIRQAHILSSYLDVIDVEALRVRELDAVDANAADHGLGQLVGVVALEQQREVDDDRR